jgi:hypothetical protein
MTEFDLETLTVTQRRALLWLSGRYPTGHVANVDVYAYEALRQHGLAKKDGYPNYKLTDAGLEAARRLSGG